MELESPYQNLDAYQPYRASLHNHTFRSNGLCTAAPSTAVGIYRLCGIPIVAITDHDNRIGPSRNILDGVVPWREEDWSHPYDDCLLVRGFEASFPQDHVNVVGISYFDIMEEWEPGEPGYVAEMKRRGAWVVLNHPAKWNESPQHVLDDENFLGCHAIEVYNGARCQAFEKGVATPLWDACLSAGHRFWCTANSDCHKYDFVSRSNPTNGWNVVWLKELSQKALFQALLSGRFYASSGLEIDDVEVSSDTISVRAGAAAAIRFIGQGGAVLAETQGPEAQYAPRGDEGYVRVELDGTGKPHPQSAVPVQAWLQPVYID